MSRRSSTVKRHRPVLTELMTRRVAPPARPGGLSLGLVMEFDSSKPYEAQLGHWAELARLAERSGFESLWVPEGFAEAGWTPNVPSAFLVLAAVAGSTRLRLGTGVTLLPAIHPLRLAYETALLDQLSGGRLLLGVGVGQPELARRFGLAPEMVATRADETLAMLRALWSGSAGFHGETLAVDGGILPRPVQPGGPPILVGGYVARSAVRAARYGDGCYLGTTTDLTVLERQIGRYWRALETEGRRPEDGIVAVNRLAVLAESEASARAAARGPVERILARYADFGRIHAESRGSGTRPDLAALADEVALVGTPDRVARLLERYAAVGVTSVHLRVMPAGTALEVAERTIQLASALRSDPLA